MVKSCKRGFKLNKKRNRCVRKKLKSSGSFKRKGKSYNPFKMWGSWVGLVVGFLYNNKSNLGCYFKSLPEGATCPSLFLPFFDFILFLIIGFLIGWGIHSLIKRLR